MTQDRLRGRAAVERRRRWLSANPLCVACLEAGRYTPATEVDHIVPLHRGGPDDPGNLQSLCSQCHARKTDADLNRTGKAGADANGMPTDPDHPWLSEGGMG